MLKHLSVVLLFAVLFVQPRAAHAALISTSGLEKLSVETLSLTTPGILLFDERPAFFASLNTVPFEIAISSETGDFTENTRIWPAVLLLLVAVLAVRLVLANQGH